MPYIEGPFSRAKYSDFIKIDEEQRAAKRAEKIRRMRLLYDSDDYSAVGVGGGHGGGGSGFPGADPPAGYGYIVNTEGNFLVDEEGAFLLSKEQVGVS